MRVEPSGSLSAHRRRAAAGLGEVNSPRLLTTVYLCGGDNGGERAERAMCQRARRLTGSNSTPVSCPHSQSPTAAAAATAAAPPPPPSSLSCPNDNQPTTHRPNRSAAAKWKINIARPPAKSSPNFATFILG